jgi:hypothetical protein
MVAMVAAVQQVFAPWDKLCAPSGLMPIQHTKAMNHRFFLVGLAAAIAFSPAHAQVLSKGEQILINQGLQVQGMVTNTDPFHLSTYQAANYTSINWLWDSNTAAQGAAPGAMPWARWARDQSEMPPRTGYNETGYMSKLIALQLGDEANLNDDATRTNYVNWFNAVRASFPNTLLYTNNYGGQVTDTALGDFVIRAKPDMLSFDTYPFQPGTGPAGGSPTNWYGDLRRYRVFALNADIPLATYRETFHASDGRDPSGSEQRLNTFAAMAFNVKYFTDFTYNSGASSLFNNAAGGDNSPNSIYTNQADINKKARNLGKAMTRLQPIDVHPNGANPTTDIMFIRGRNGANVPNALPIGFVADAQAPNSYSDWVFQRNDPYLNGWTVTNNGTKNGGQVGDVIVAWFKTLDESFDGPAFADERYMMVINGLTDPTGTAADASQHVTMDFLFGTAAGHLTGIQRLNPDTGLVENVALTPIGSGKYRWSFDLDGGGAELFKFNDGAPFVGVTPVPEPSALVLLGPLAAGFGAWRRRRSRR